MLTTYGDISPRTAGYATKELLKRGQNRIITERFLQQKPLPKRSTRTMKFRRYESLSLVTAPLGEGIPPAGSKPTFTDVFVTLEMFGDFLELTDVIQDTHEDPILNEYMDLLSEQARDSLEVYRISILRSGTSVFYPGAAVQRSEVAATINKGMLDLVERSLLTQKAKYYTKTVKASVMVSTEPVGECFVVLCHHDLASDIRKLPDFTPYEQYSQMAAFPNEEGKTGRFRFITSQLVSPFLAGGAAVGATGMKSVGAANVDVYPMIVLAPDAAATVPLKGKNGVQIFVLNPNVARGGDPLGQKGSVGWKTWSACVILNQGWIARMEVGATATPAYA